MDHIRLFITCRLVYLQFYEPPPRVRFPRWRDGCDRPHGHVISSSLVLL